MAFIQKQIQLTRLEELNFCKLLEYFYEEQNQEVIGISNIVVYEYDIGMFIKIAANVKRKGFAVCPLCCFFNPDEFRRLLNEPDFDPRCFSSVNNGLLQIRFDEKQIGEFAMERL